MFFVEIIVVNVLLLLFFVRTIQIGEVKSHQWTCSTLCWRLSDQHRVRCVWWACLKPEPGTYKNSTRATTQKHRASWKIKRETEPTLLKVVFNAFSNSLKVSVKMNAVGSTVWILEFWNEVLIRWAQTVREVTENKPKSERNSESYWCWCVFLCFVFYR